MSASLRLSDDSSTIRPLLTAVVRLKSYGKGDDVHVCKNKRPHLLVLTPDALQIFTTSDAGFGRDKERDNDAESPTAAQAAFVSKLNNVAGKGLNKISSVAGMKSKKIKDVFKDEKPTMPSQEPVVAATPLSSSGPSGSQAGEEPEDLAEGQVFRLGVSLNQILEVRIVKENRVAIFYQPNRPSKKGTVEEQTMMVLRAVLTAVDLVTGREAGTPVPPAPHPNAHQFTIVAADKEEAEDIKDDIERAQRQLACAALWLSEGLPLRAESSIMMVTISSNSNAREGTFLPFPQWGESLILPSEISTALAGNGSISRRALSTVITIYLSTPLGPAIAEIPAVKLLHSAQEGSAPIVTTAVLKEPHRAEDSLRPGKRWSVTLQWQGFRAEALDYDAEDRTGAQGTNASVRDGNTSRPTSPIDSSQPHHHHHHHAKYQRSSNALVTSSNTVSSPPMSLLVGLAAISGVAAIARGVKGQLARLRAPPTHADFPTTSASDGNIAITHADLKLYQWKLMLLDLSIEEEMERRAPASPPIKRAVSISVSAMSMNQEVPIPPGEQLPHHIQLLVQQYPDAMSVDTARRFIIGLGSETKAFAALSSMAQWMTENRLIDIIKRPQPAFEAMKKHYPHGFPGWSKKKDCLVELECMGRWPSSYTKIASEGISEAAMLEHLLFVYQYAFNRLDSRPLPHGKTIKIVDLEGLSMGDLRTPGFKLITRVGAMLSMNYPQRLQRCFLINAPGWWAVAWRIISPIIPPKVRAQMSLYSKNDAESARKAMLEWIDEDVLPKKYGGTGSDDWTQWVYEKELVSYVAGLNGAANDDGLFKESKKGSGSIIGEDDDTSSYVSARE